MRYYSTLRPVSIGSYPEKDRVKEIVNFNDRQYVDEIEHEAWGYIEYDGEIDEGLAKRYDLVSNATTLWYCVQCAFYDNGKVRAAIVNTVRAVNNPESISKELKRCDVYAEWYASQEEAEQAVKDALSA